MTTNAVLAPLTRQQFFDNNGKPLSGGLLYSYSAGTNTPAATFTDSTGSVQNPNPLTLDARGSCSLWVTPNVALKLNVTDSNGNTLPGYPIDQVTVSQLLSLYAGVDDGTTNNYVLEHFTASFSSLTNGIVLYWVPANTSTSVGSTLNVIVNGQSLGGAIQILNLNGTAIGAGQIVANQITQTVYYAGNWYLNTLGQYQSPLIGTFGSETALISATTTDLGTATAHVVKITGTTAITSFGSSASLVAPIYVVRFTGALTLTNSSALLLPQASTITTSAGDALLAEYLGSGNWQVLLYQSAVLYGSFTGTITGCTAAVTGTINYAITNPLGTRVATSQIVTLWTTTGLTGTSNANTLTVTGLPNSLNPAANVTVSCLCTNGGAADDLAFCTVGGNTLTFAIAYVSAPYVTSGSANWVTSSTKGLGTDWTITYPLI